MQDREYTHNHLDEEFMDQAWANMRSQLDQEMPVVPTKKRRKPYWFFLFFLLIGFGAGIGMMWYWSTAVDVIPKSPTINQVAPKQPIAGLMPGSGMKNPVEQLTKKASQEELPEPVPLPPDRSPESLDSPPIADSAPPDQTKNSSFITNKKTLNDKNSTLNDLPTLNTTSTTSTPTIQLASNPVVQQEESTKKDLIIEKQAAFSLLTELPATSISADYDRQTRLTEPLHFEKPSRWNVGFQVATITTNGFNFTGISSGFVAEYQLDRRFSLSTGITYRFFQIEKDDAFFRYNGDSRWLTQEELDQNNPAIVNNLSNSDHFFAALPIYSMEYLSVPLLLSYRPNRWLRINTGLQLDRLINTDIRVDNDFEDAYISPQGEVSESKVRSLVEQGIKKWNTTAVIGLMYQPTKRISLGAKFNYGLTDFTNDKVFNVSQFDAHQYTEWSFTYFF